MASEEVETQRHITWAGLLGFLCILVCLVWLLQWSEATRKLDRLLHDTWVRAQQREVPSDIVIASIDSDSLSELGRWPWPRALQARLFEQLKVHDVRAVVIDLLYVEPDSQSGSDVILADAIASLPVSILPVLIEGGKGQRVTESLPTSVITRRTTDFGHIFLPIDDDGIVRRVFLKSGFKRAHWSALSLAALQAIDGAPETLPGKNRDVAGGAGQWVENHEVLIPFYGPSGSFKRIPAVDIIQSKVPLRQLAGKIVFVGMTTTGLGDVVPTPVSALNQPVPGVEIHANVFSALRDHSLITTANGYTSLYIALGLLPLMLLVYSRAPPKWGFLATFLGAGVPIAVSYSMYRFAGLWFPPLSASLPIFVSYLLWSWHRLDYVNRFLEHEFRKLEADLPSQQEGHHSGKLVDFFKSASRHLPVSAWRFQLGSNVHQDGQGLPVERVEGYEGGWRVRSGILSRQYPGKHNLHIELAISDAERSADVAAYVDARVRKRAGDKNTPLFGSIEKLQTNALKLSEQTEWLRNFKVFSETLLDGSPMGFGVWNVVGVCVRANRLLYRMVPEFKERDEFIDFLRALGRQPESADDAQTMRELILDARPWQLTCNTGDRELVVNFSAIGETLVDRLVCVNVIDVTDIRTSERARAEMVDYLSHDLRSPLISALYLLGPNSDPQIEQNIQQSLGMMDDLLHVARADSLSEAQFEPLLLNAVLDNALDQMQPQALNKNIRFNVDTADDEFWIEGDAASLERAIANIIGNAIKYSPADTFVTIKLSKQYGNAVVTIDDQGVGIDPSMLDKLFTRFKRDAGTADQFKGIGLGLALVSRVVTLHSGTVSANNTGSGTRIMMSLPLEQVANSPG